jgi:hypothetical protein
MIRLRSYCQRTGFFLGILGLWIMLGACSSPKPVPAQVQVPSEMKKILVVMFRNMSPVTEGSQGVRCPLSGKVFQAGKVESGAEEILNGRLREILKDRPQVSFISSRQFQETQSGLMTESGKEANERLLLIETARKMGADAVLAGHIYRFKDRVGGKYSVESSATTAFDLHFLRVSDGRVTWSNHFDETQKALTDDLFQIKSFMDRDGQWITSEQMGVAGLNSIMEGFKLP